NVNVFPMVTTNYTVIGSANACTSTAVRQVTVIQLPTLQAISDKYAICEGDQTQINANGANSYTWTPTTGLSNPFANFVVANPIVSTTYVLVGNNGVCTASLNVPIEVLKKPITEITTNRQKICYGDVTTIFATGAQSFSWSPTNSLTFPSNAMAIASPSVSTNYTIIGINSSGSFACVHTKEILIDIVQPVTAQASPSVEFCQGESVRLNASGSNTYKWYPSIGLNNANIPSPYASPKISTVYTVNVSDDGNCASTATVFVKVNPLPSVDAGRDTTYNLDQPMYLNAKGTGSMKWIFGEGILCHDCPDSQIMPENSGCYIIETTNQYGCKAKDEVCIEVTKEYAIYIPNIFTPNFDGVNDVFLVYGTGITEIEMNIFDRWGEKLFVSSDQLIGWDGTYKNELSKNDVYSYLIKYTTLDGKKHVKTGHVTLMK
ncbi:MAG: gliding motility-associated C-terminal domain-containing protein, partial [Flavobacteriales bacterium]|nr:gliding motility-associated C-terminal domain-containing protein [Flavobacteriales bacterium]